MENRELVKSLVNAGLETTTRLRTARLGLQKAQETLRFWELELASAERDNQKSNSDIKLFGFHDIGHARTELAKPEEMK